MSINAFYNCIDMGDLIYSLLFCKLLDVKTLYVDGGCGKVKFDWNSANFLLPLIKNQPYLNTVELYNGQEFDCDYGLHPDNIPVVLGANLLQYHSSKFGVDPESRRLNNEIWMTADRDESVIDKKVLINRSARYHGDSRFYHMILSTNPISDFLFAGLESEYLTFRQEFNVPSLDFIKTDSSIKLASIIETVPVFLGNQSLICAIATGLGKVCYVEYGRMAANYLFNRQNIFYF